MYLIIVNNALLALLAGLVYIIFFYLSVWKELVASAESDADFVLAGSDRVVSVLCVRDQQ